MNPVHFPEANARIGPPPGLTGSQVRTIYAHIGQVNGGSVDGAAQVIVAWKPTPEEITAIQNGALVFLSCLGGLPPHFLCTSFQEAAHPA